MKKVIIISLLILSIIGTSLGVYWYKINVVQPQAEADANKWFQFDVSVFEAYGIDLLPLRKEPTYVPLVIVYNNVLFFGGITHDLNLTKVYYKFEGTSYFFWFVHVGIGYKYHQQFGW